MCGLLVTHCYLEIPFTVYFMSRDLRLGQRDVSIWLTSGQLWCRVMSIFSLLTSGRFAKAIIRAAFAT